MAGVLSQGEGCVAGMRSAARLMNLDDCTSGVVEVVQVGEPRHRKGVVVHQTQWLPRLHITKVDGIPVTTATRTLLDLGGVVSLHALEVALESAIRMGLTSQEYLQRQLEATRSRGRTGCGAISHVLRIRCGLKTTESAFETKLFQTLRDGRLPLPERQVPVYTSKGLFVARPDFLYPSAKLAIEALSRKHHFGALDPARDASRRNRLVAAGYRVLEITYNEMTDTPQEVVNQVAEALGIRLF